MKQTLFHLCLMVLISATVLFTNLGTARLWDRDEPRNAGAAFEMLERGDWVVPIFNDQLRHQKPALTYWLIMISYTLFGVSEFSARFGSAILAVGTVLATYGIGRRLFDARSALWGAIALSTSLMFVVAGRAATPDSVLIFCSTMALYFYVLGTFSPERSAKATDEDIKCFPDTWRWILPMYAMMGIGTLAKGPVAVIVPCAIIGMFMLLQRLSPVDETMWNRQGSVSRLLLSIWRTFHPYHFFATVWKMRPLFAVLIILAIAAPWYVWVGLRTDGDWLQMFFLQEHVGRATTALEGHHGGWWYYPLAILAGFFPWSVFMGPMFVQADRELTARGVHRKAMMFLLCWVGVQVGLFSLAQTKLPSYVTPCYPALGLLAGFLFQRLTERATSFPTTLYRYGLICLPICGLLLSVGLFFVGQHFLEQRWGIALVGLIPLLGGSVAYWCFWKSKFRESTVAFGATAVLLMIGIFGFVTVAVDQQQQSHRILDRLRGDNQTVPVATFRCLESSWVYYSRQSIYELSDIPCGESWVEPREKTWKAKDRPSPEQFAAAHENALFITTDRDLDELLARLPQGYQELERVPYFLRDKEMVLVGSVAETANEPTLNQWR